VFNELAMTETVSRVEVVRPSPMRRRQRVRRPSPGIPGWVWGVTACGIGFVLVAATVATVVLLRDRGTSITGRSEISRRDFEKIKAGMSVAEVLAVLGRPTEEVDTSALAGFFPKDKVPLPNMRLMVWTDRRTYQAVVQFLDDRAVTTLWQDGVPPGGGIGNGNPSAHDQWLEKLKDQRRQEREDRHFRRR
jgi:hypothetical protein